MSAAGPSQGANYSPSGGSAAAKPQAWGSNTSDGVFLIHGLGGTQYDLGSMHKRLKNAGLVTHSLTLPGHGLQPEDLVGVTAEDWIDAVVAKYREIRGAHPTLHLMGMCMGALLAAMVDSCCSRRRYSLMAGQRPGIAGCGRCSTRYPACATR